ncbi:MAG: oligopeptide/dipeptide ABC transporter ATP-binding protein, partial [Planctomycetota bacterium]
AKDLFNQPLHPYTRGLMGSIPHEDDRGKPLYAIPGNVPSIMDFPTGCRFCTRCDVVMDKCETVEPELREVAPGRMVRCHLDDLGTAANKEGN